MSGTGNERYGRLVEEIGPQGRRLIIYEYRGRRFDVTSYFFTTPIVPEIPPVTTDQLQVKDVNLHIGHNQTAHHTDKYETTDLILRRGQEFQVSLKLNRPFDSKNDYIAIEFRTGTHPLLSQGTRIVVEVSNKLEPKKWGFKVYSSIGNDVTLTIKSSANAIVGKYQLDILTHVITNEEKKHEFRMGLDKTVYVLFNPWCKDDNVYMDGEDEKEEYVLNDFGYIWYGTSRYLGKRQWNFGHFDKDVFECVMYLLGKQVTDKYRGNPITVSRAMSAAVNVQDDGGVLSGRWDGDYEDGVKPSTWQGSVAILEQYMETKTSVKYGQCWVFSGLLTTVLRCLGIPARSVTNFASAHDTDRSVTIDECVDAENNPIEELNGDSVWNFHVWNDCWMARPDLPVGFGGWQAVDATPQETSEGVFQTGPCSLNAIKQGQVYLLYDAPFVFAEVNADRVYWQCTRRYGDWDMKKIRTERSSVGRNMSTKSVGGPWRHDVTDQYKYPEGSKEERVAVRRAIMHGDRPEIVDDEVTSEDIEYKIVNKDVLMLGKDFDIEVNLVNTSMEPRSVDLVINIQVCYYTGVRADRVKKESQIIRLKGKESRLATFRVTVDEYLDKLVEQSQFKVFLLGKVYETKQLIVTQDDFRLETPDLAVKLVTAPSARVNQMLKVEVSFTNPLSRTLNGCTFTIEGPGHIKPLVEKYGNISPGQEVKHILTMTPRMAGRKVILVDFDCNQFENVMGSIELDVVA